MNRDQILQSRATRGLFFAIALMLLAVAVGALRLDVGSAGIDALFLAALTVFGFGVAALLRVIFIAERAAMSESEKVQVS